MLPPASHHPAGAGAPAVLQLSVRLFHGTSTGNTRKVCCHCRCGRRTLEHPSCGEPWVMGNGKPGMGCHDGSKLLGWGFVDLWARAFHVRWLWMCCMDTPHGCIEWAHHTETSHTTWTHSTHHTDASHRHITHHTDMSRRHHTEASHSTHHTDMQGRCLWAAAWYSVGPPRCMRGNRLGQYCLTLEATGVQGTRQGQNVIGRKDKKQE